MARSLRPPVRSPLGYATRPCVRLVKKNTSALIGIV